MHFPPTLPFPAAPPHPAGTRSPLPGGGSRPARRGAGRAVPGGFVPCGAAGNGRNLSDLPGLPSARAWKKPPGKPDASRRTYRAVLPRLLPLGPMNSRASQIPGPGIKAGSWQSEGAGVDLSGDFGPRGEVGVSVGAGPLQGWPGMPSGAGDAAGLGRSRAAAPAALQAEPFGFSLD